jgi:hypothetical protein
MAGDKRNADRGEGVSWPEQLSKRIKTSTPGPTVQERKRMDTLYTQLYTTFDLGRVQAAEQIVTILLAENSPWDVTEHFREVLWPLLALVDDHDWLKGEIQEWQDKPPSSHNICAVITELLFQLFGNHRATSSEDQTPDRQAIWDMRLADMRINLKYPEENKCRILAIGCFVKAKAIKREEWEDVLNLLCFYAQANWDEGRPSALIPYQASWVILQAISELDQEMVEMALLKLAPTRLQYKVEGSCMWLSAHRRFPDMPSLGRFGGSLHEYDLQHLARRLGNAVEDIQQHEYWYTGFISMGWQEALDHFSRPYRSSPTGVASVWKSIVDGE